MSGRLVLALQGLSFPDTCASSHELFGFDIMLEDDLKPYLIEVNISPSMASSSQLDRDIKGEPDHA